MFAFKIFVLCILVLGVKCRSTFHRAPENEITGYGVQEFGIDDRGNIIVDDYEDLLSEQPFESVYPAYLKNLRVRRQVHGSVSTDLEGSTDIHANLPIAGNKANKLSGVASLTGLKLDGKVGSVGGGLAFENVKGHALIATAQHVPDLGQQLTAAAKINLLNTEKHKVNANAFITKNLPTIPDVPNFTTKGGSLDYTFKNKVGASLGMSQTNFLQRKDFSAMTNANLFRNPHTSIDVNAGFTKSVSPFISNNKWKPSVGFTLTKFF